MPISYVEMFQPQQMDAVGQILAGGTNALSGAINNSVQLGRDMVNLRASQEKEYLAERGRNEEMSQRRAEFLTNQRNTDRQFYENVFNANREFDYKEKTGNRSFLYDIYKNDQDYKLHEKDVLSAIGARKETADYHVKALAAQERINTIRAQNYRRGTPNEEAVADWYMGKTGRPGTTPATGAATGAAPSPPRGLVDSALDTMSDWWKKVFTPGDQPGEQPAISPLPGAAPGVAPVGPGQSPAQGAASPGTPAAPTAPTAPAATGTGVPDEISPNDPSPLILGRAKDVEALGKKLGRVDLLQKAAELERWGSAKLQREKVELVDDKLATAARLSGEKKLLELGSAVDVVAATLGRTRNEVIGMDIDTMREVANGSSIDIKDADIKKFIRVLTEYKNAVSGGKSSTSSERTPNLFGPAVQAVTSAVKDAVTGKAPAVNPIKAAADHYRNLVK